MPVYPVRPNLPVKYSTEIGRIITRWARLEWELRRISYSILQIGPKEGRLAVREPRAQDYLAMVQDLMKVRNLKSTAELKALNADIKKLSELRNAIAHGVWLKHADTKLPVLQVVSGTLHHVPGQQAPKAKIDPQAIAFKLSALKAASIQIERLTHAVQTLRLELEAQLPSSPDKPPE